MRVRSTIPSLHGSQWRGPLAPVRLSLRPEGTPADPPPSLALGSAPALALLEQHRALLAWEVRTRRPAHACACLPARRCLHARPVNIAKHIPPTPAHPHIHIETQTCMHSQWTPLRLAHSTGLCSWRAATQGAASSR